MTSKALVIRTAGDHAMAGAIADGLLARENAELRAENARLRAELGVLRARDHAQWVQRIRANRREYRCRRPSRLARKLLTAWAGLTMGIMGR